MKREIVLGDRFGERYEVTAGLSAGEVLAIDGIDVLRDGARVKVKPDLKAKVQEK
jgi:multidrug efflux pump subunit AcrA (membrane-fusion protein)